MKVLLATLVLLSTAAHAEPQNISLTCDAHELAPGKAARNGQVTIALATDGKYVNSHWTVNVNWKGVDDALVEPGSVCGVAVSEQCFEKTRGWNGGAFGLTQACGVGPIDTRGLPHHVTDVSITLALLGGVAHGRFSCAAHDVGNYASIELSNCK